MAIHRGKRFEVDMAEAFPKGVVLTGDVDERDRAIAQGLDDLVKKSRREAAKKKREQRRKRAG